MENGKEYYLGLDIGTDSVGYAVTDASYTLKKFKGEPMWGATLFEAAQGAQERRAFRVGRRRIDRRQQRIELLSELFAAEIGKIDPNFFIRRKESRLFSEDSQHGTRLFEGEGITDREYHANYKTIHHLILELMSSTQKHDIRLIYMACAWLVANRGHFLFDIPAENISEILSFEGVYADFKQYIADEGYTLPWSAYIEPEEEPQRVLDVLKAELGIKAKENKFRQDLFGGKKIIKGISEEFPFSAEAVVSLLSGGKVKPAELFCNAAYEDVESVSLVMNDDDYNRIVSELGDDAELLNKLRAVKNCAQLIDVMNGASCISQRKVDIYEQHNRDLKTLKYLVNKYCPDKYNEIFRDAVEGNYASYTGNVRSCPKEELSKTKKTNKEIFSDFIIKRMKALSVDAEDKAKYKDMMRRLEARTFLPKQKDTDNRVIPQQLYRYELTEILKQAQSYTPFLNEKDSDGISVSDKIVKIFDFRIPYFVGPLRTDNGKNSWMVRKEDGRILPWSFERLVDIDGSEQEFIRKMTNSCTYVPGTDASVLPSNSLLYQRFTVLNELNNIKINGSKVSVEAKQDIYELFEKYPRVTPKKIKDHLIQRGYMGKQDELSGIDETVKSGIRSYHAFKRLLESGCLSEKDAETIIERAAYSEDKSRMKGWLLLEYPRLSEQDAAYILRQNFKGFGRLSRKFLTEIYGTEKGSDGEVHSIIDMLWSTNENLMQLLSERYTFGDTVRELREEYYSSCPRTLDEQLSEMYVSNAVKRPIYRTIDIIQDVVKAMGAEPSKVFVEMARGAAPEQKGKRTLSRKNQLMELYKKIKSEDARRLAEELEAMGPAADNRLQSDKLFLYYLQLGKCLYSGRPIDLKRIADGTYNRDHIYPQCYVKDDSVLNNLVLVESEINGNKTDVYPLSADIRSKMQPYWQYLKSSGLMTEEKYRRLTRTTPFTDEEKQGFINRQLVETRQSTKAVATLLKERFPNAEIVYVKAGMVSEFRKEFSMLKSRLANDLHHAKDAYLNIVVGNVYNERFTKGFSLGSSYNVQVKSIFKKPHGHGGVNYWNGESDIARVRKTVEKNAVHLTRYAFCRRGGLFDQQPVKKAAGLIPLKKGLPTEKYGGYNKPTASFFVLARFNTKKGREVMIVPVNLLDAEKFLADKAFALSRTEEMIANIKGSRPENTELLLGGRPLKVNTVFSLDGMLVTLSGKSSGGSKVLLSSLTPLMLGHEDELYVKAMESFTNKRKTNQMLQPSEQFDKLSKEKNVALFDRLVQKLESWPYCKIPGAIAKNVNGSDKKEKFKNADIIEQINCLTGIIQLINGNTTICDLTVIGESKSAGAVQLNSSLSNWKKQYTDVRILDRSASGFFEKRSENLMELL